MQPTNHGHMIDYMAGVHTCLKILQWTPGSRTVLQTGGVIDYVPRPRAPGAPVRRRFASVEDWERA